LAISSISSQHLLFVKSLTFWNL